MRLTILILTLLIANISFAATFPVTSNADSGPGTLREAIQKAADNGVGQTDNIVFSLIGSSKQDRTITVLSPLPNLTSNLIIDGSTQYGQNLSVNGAKVAVEFDIQQTDKALLYTEQSSNIEIYGLDFHCASHNTYCFLFDGVTHFVFGAAGKGNVITGFNKGIYNFNQEHINRDFVIQGNFFGVDESGTVLDNNLMDHAIFVYSVYDMTIGGDQKGDANIICAVLASVSDSYQDVRQTGFTKIINNHIGTDITGTKRFSGGGFRSSMQFSGYNDGNPNPGGTTDVTVELTNNVIGGDVSLTKLRSTFYLKGNRFGTGTDDSNISSGFDYASLGLYYCNDGIIGGENDADKNYFTNYANGIGEWYAGNITISKNSFQCNRFAGIAFNSWANGHIQPFINITSVSITNISGNSLPNAKIELFYNDDCGFTCEGETYITTLTATERGDWNYTGLNCTNIVATATDTYGATSEFSGAVVNQSQVQIANTFCEKANGSITNMRVTSGTSWHWEDDKGNIISTDLNLLNVPSGRYLFKASIGYNLCTTSSIWYTIANQNLPDNPTVTTTNIVCGQSTGSLSVEQNNDYNATWLTQNNNSVGAGFTVSNLPPGNYFLTLSAINDASCTKTYGPYEIKSDIANSFDLSNVVIANALCGIGNITGVKYSAPLTPDVFLQWEDESGIVWRRDHLDMMAVPAGRYHLKLKDPANCDTLITPFYTIVKIGSIIGDISQMQIAGGSKCGEPHGSITGIKATNGETFTWTNANGVIEGNTLDINNLQPGDYKVLISNHYGCDPLSLDAVVPTVPNPDLTATRADTKPGFCGVSDGYIHPLGIQNADQYSFRWTNVLSPDVVVSQTLHLDNILSGNYNLYATDKNGCEESLGQFELTSLPPPVINEEGKAIVNAMCGDSSGLITGLTISGGAAPFSEIWKDASGNVISTNGKAENLAPNTYHLEMEDSNRCKTSSSEFIVANGMMNYLSPIYPDLIIPRGSSATLATTNPQSGRYSLFTDASSSVPLQQNETGTFTTGFLTEDKSFYVTVTRGSCMGNNTIVHIKVADATIVSVPSAFTPNGDGLNDIVRPVVQGLFALEDFSVYDRFGHLVFRTTEMNKGWKGDKNGLRLDTGTYIWIIKGKDINNKPLLQKGTIVLIH